MAQTPVSASILYNSSTPTTIYTVPATKTAVVKGILAASQVTSQDVVTVNKVSGGVTYPIVTNQTTGYINASTQYFQYTGIKSLNLLQSPITLAAGDSISISTNDTSYYKAEIAATSANYKIANFNYLNGYYIAVGIDNSTGYGLILTSTDGITYTQRTFTAAVQLTNVVYGNGYYVVCNLTGGTIHHSTDLITWTEVALPSTYPCYALVYGGGKFVTGGDSGYSYYATTTPLSWTAATVFQGNTIRAIAYIGTNYFYGTNGISYYTTNFTNYTQPYVSSITGFNPTGAIAASPNKVLVTSTNIQNSAPNNVLRQSADGVTWSVVNTSGAGGSLTSYYGLPHYAANGGYTYQRYTNDSTMWYLASADGLTWTAYQPTFLTGYSNSGNYSINPAYENTSNASYQNKCLIYQYAAGQYYLQGCNVSSSGVLSSQNFSFAASQIGSGQVTINVVPVYAGNPFDGSWVCIAFYAPNQYTGAYWYGSGPNQGADGQYTYGIYNPSYGYQAGNGVSAGVMPNSPKFLGGTTTGYVWIADGYSSGFNVYMGSPSYVTNPAGFNWTSAGSGSANVSAFARSGDSSNSILVILWSNGYFGRTNNQGSSWTFGSVGASSFATQQTLRNAKSLVYNNGKFWAVNTSGLTVFSTDGIAWSTMQSAVDSIYYFNSQNVFISTTGISTSATGVVDIFTQKTGTNYTNSSPSVNKLTYDGTNYYLTNGSTLYRSTDLITWTSKSFNTTQINEVTYWSANYSGIAYSGTGTSISLSTANTTTAVVNSTISKPFVPTTNTYVGAATASIVQLD
jgi:hypothetical protein